MRRQIFMRCFTAPAAAPAEMPPPPPLFAFDAFAACFRRRRLFRFRLPRFAGFDIFLFLPCWFADAPRRADAERLPFAAARRADFAGCRADSAAALPPIELRRCFATSARFTIRAPSAPPLCRLLLPPMTRQSRRADAEYAATVSHLRRRYAFAERRFDASAARLCCRATPAGRHAAMIRALRATQMLPRAAPQPPAPPAQNAAAANPRVLRCAARCCMPPLHGTAAAVAVYRRYVCRLPHSARLRDAPALRRRR